MLCDVCRAGFRRITPPLCARCGAPTAWPVERCRECAGRKLAFVSARAAVAYAGPARSLVSAWKEHGLRRAASLAAELVAEIVPAPAADAITYIPPDPNRLLERGHHPAERLARELAGRWGLECAPLLARAGGGATRRQASLARDERLRNLRGAFAPLGDVPARVAVVDDVYTTGATATEAASALLRGGAAAVEAIAFARTTRLGAGVG